MKFRCMAMTTEAVNRLRDSGIDDFDNPVRRMTAVADTGFFCRHCLAQPGKGRDILLGSYNVARPKGHYWSPSPIFLCAAACERFERDDEIPPAVRAIQLVNVRPYDADERLLYDLNDTTTGDHLQPLLERCLADPRTEYVNIHTGRPGCFLCRVERSS
jgi:hypothetical protein